jgi:hypothetical protein
MRDILRKHELTAELEDVSQEVGWMTFSLQILTA